MKHGERKRRQYRILVSRRNIAPSRLIYGESGKKVKDFERGRKPDLEKHNQGKNCVTESEPGGRG